MSGVRNFMMRDTSHGQFLSASHPLRVRFLWDSDQSRDGPWAIGPKANIRSFKGSAVGALLGDDRSMSALGQKQTFAVHQPMSALPPKADMCGAISDVRYGPKADISARGSRLSWPCFDVSRRDARRLSWGYAFNSTWRNDMERHPRFSMR
jgi:hypothetical protein